MGDVVRTAIGVSFVLIGAVLFVKQVPLVWREGRLPFAGPEADSVRPEFGGRLLRTLPLLYVWAISLGWTLIWASSFDRHATEPGESPALAAISDVTFLTPAMLFVLLMLVAFYNWPKFCVPPPLRQQAGWAALSRERSRAAKRKKRR